jgi:probable phosphomutase (TIGR03848 family)
MTTTLFLVRHAAHDLLGRVLTGRMEGVGLSAEGRVQAALLVERLAGESIAALYTSPLERTRETAAAIAARLPLQPVVLDGVVEVDYGDWSGTSFEDLANDPRWSAWNASKSTLRPPGGESLIEVQCRAIGALEQVCAAHPDAAVAVISHGDVIKAALAHYLGLPLEGIARFEVSPASVSIAAVGPWGAKVHAINEVVRP